MLTSLVLEKLLVHHGYKFLNDEAWNLIAKRENKRCRAFLSIGTFVWSLESAEVTVAKAPKSVLWAEDSISFFFQLRKGAGAARGT